MNVNRKNAGVKKAAAMLATQSRTEAVAQLKEEYTTEELDEILEAYDASHKPSFNKEYEEWRCEVRYNDAKKENVAEKLKLIRRNVRITEDEAETLNAGARSTIGSFQIMYYLPE